MPVLREVVVDVLRVRGGGGRPAEPHHLGAQHPLETRVHFFFFDELATVGLRDACPHRRAQAGFLRQQAQRGVLHQVLGVSPCLDGNLRELRFLLGCEVDFHVLQDTEMPAVKQRHPG
jgi:hypothetical protein